MVVMFWRFFFRYWYKNIPWWTFISVVSCLPWELDPINIHILSSTIYELPPNGGYWMGIRERWLLYHSVQVVCAFDDAGWCYDRYWQSTITLGTGEDLVSYSPDEDPPTVRSWNIGSTGNWCIPLRKLKRGGQVMNWCEQLNPQDSWVEYWVFRAKKKRNTNYHCLQKSELQNHAHSTPMIWSFSYCLFHRSRYTITDWIANVRIVWTSHTGGVLRREDTTVYPFEAWYCVDVVVVTVRW